MKYSKEQITALQIAMINMKEYKGRPDGIPGPLTRAGVLAILKELESPTVTPEVLLPSDSGAVIAPGKMPKPEFITVKGVKFNQRAYATKSKGPEGLVVHFTVSGRTAKNAEGVVRYLAGKGLGCPVMDEDGKIYVAEGFDILKHSAAHAGKSAWAGYSGLNSSFAGIEICSWGSAGAGKGTPVRKITKKTANQYPGTYEAYTPEQEAALVNLCLWLEQNAPGFSLDRVAGHDEVALPAGRKNDPGGSLSMTMPAFRERLKSFA